MTRRTSRKLRSNRRRTSIRRNSGSEPKIYCTSYCNFGHNMKTGRPIGHECRVIPPAALRAERAGDYGEAQRILSTGKRSSLRRNSDTPIVVRFKTTDGGSERRSFKTLAAAQKYAQSKLGEHPEISETYGYAVGAYGDAKIMVSGADLSDLFPPRGDDLGSGKFEVWVEVPMYHHSTDGLIGTERYLAQRCKSEAAARTYIREQASDPFEEHWFVRGPGEQESP
jgi:hypothetical protein